jgi:hypothetical protein
MSWNPSFYHFEETTCTPLFLRTKSFETETRHPADDEGATSFSRGSREFAFSCSTFNCDSHSACILKHAIAYDVSR